MSARVISARAADKWVPRMKRGMTAGLAGEALSHGERVGVRGYGARRRAGRAAQPLSRPRLSPGPPSPAGRGNRS